MTTVKTQRISDINFEKIAAFILSEAKRNGATEAEISLGANKGFTVSAQNGDVETIEYHQDKSVSIDVYFGKRSGSASISDLREDSIKNAVLAACHIAKFTGEDEASGLADPAELAYHYPEMELRYPWSISVPDAINMTTACERIALQQDKRLVRAEEVSLTTLEGFYLYANSHGFLGTIPHTQHSMNCVMVAKEGDDMERDYSYTVACDPIDLMNPEALAKEAASKTIKRLGARVLSTRKAPILFIPEEARGLVKCLASAIAGGSIYKKASFLLDQVGQQIFPSFIHIHEKPDLPKGLGTAPFDDDGIATRANCFVKDGVLQHYAMGVYSARKLGMKSTGNAGGYHNLLIDSTAGDLSELLKKMDTGLLVTEMMGNGVNLITGDYSKGAGGFWVERGEIQYPVHEITIASTLQQMFRQIVAVGSDIDIRGNIRTGSILIEEMMIAGE